MCCFGAGLRAHGGTLTQLQIVKAPFPPMPVGTRLCHSGSGLLGCHVVTDVPMALCGAAPAPPVTLDLSRAGGVKQVYPADSPCDGYKASLLVDSCGSHAVICWRVLPDVTKIQLYAEKCGNDAQVHCCSGDSLHMWDPSGRLLQSSGTGASDKLPDASGIARSYTHVETSLPARFADQFAPWSVCGELNALSHTAPFGPRSPTLLLHTMSASCFMQHSHQQPATRHRSRQDLKTGAAGDDVNKFMNATLIRLALRNAAGDDAVAGVDSADSRTAKVCLKPSYMRTCSANPASASRGSMKLC